MRTKREHGSAETVPTGCIHPQGIGRPVRNQQRRKDQFRFGVFQTIEQLIGKTKTTGGKRERNWNVTTTTQTDRQTDRQTRMYTQPRTRKHNRPPEVVHDSSIEPNVLVVAAAAAARVSLSVLLHVLGPSFLPFTRQYGSLLLPSHIYAPSLLLMTSVPS